MSGDLKKYKIKRKFKENIDPEEIFVDSEKLKKIPQSERDKLEKPIKGGILRLFFIFALILLVFLLGKTFHLQIIKGSYWKELAEENRIRSYPIKSLRGIIYDRNRIPLTQNIAKLDLVVVPSDLSKLDNYKELINKIARNFSESTEEILNQEKEIKKKIEENIHLSYPISIKENIEREKALFLETEFSDVVAIRIEKESQRKYVDGPYFSHILGYLGETDKEETSREGYFLDDYVGRTGVEKTYETFLRGVYGAKLVEIDNLGKTQKVLATKESQDGHDLILSIDAELQKKLYQALKNKLDTLYISKAAAVALNPQNGKILALVSFPSFDNNGFIEGFTPESFDRILNNENKPLFNRVIAGEYPPGSTIKPLIAAAALEEGIIESNRTINCPGYLSLPDKYNPNVVWTFNDWKAHGIVDIYKAIAESCNVYFYTIGGGYKNIEGLGIERIKKYLNLFGWGEKLGIKLPGEEDGFIPSSEWKERVKKESWYIGDTYHASIGQGDITATPLQVAIGTAAIANGGIVYQPQLLEEQKPKTLNKNFIKSEFVEVVQRGMREAVIFGSAKHLYDLPVKVAGKTGTAQVSKTKNPHSWFTSFAPYENPEIVLTILIENGGEGSTNAVPVAKEVLSWWFSRDEDIE